MYKELFKNSGLDSIEKLSKSRRKNIKAAVFKRINASRNKTIRESQLKLNPALAAAVTAVAITGVTAGALSSPPDVKVNGDAIEPWYYNIYGYGRINCGNNDT